MISAVIIIHISFSHDIFLKSMILKFLCKQMCKLDQWFTFLNLYVSLRKIQPFHDISNELVSHFE